MVAVSAIIMSRLTAMSQKESATVMLPVTSIETAVVISVISNALIVSIIIFYV